MHEQIDNMEEQIVRTLEQVYQIPKAPPHKTRNIRANGPKEYHLGIVRIMLKLSPQKILIRHDHPQPDNNNDRQAKPMVFLLAHVPSAIEDLNLDVDKELLIFVIGLEFVLAVSQDEVVEFFFCDVHGMFGD